MDLNSEYLSRLAEVECRDATFKGFKKQGLVFDKAIGSTIVDVEGKEYIDFCAGFGALALGHNHQIARGVYSRMANDPLPMIEHGMGDVFASSQKVRFLETLSSMLPERYKTGALSISGTGAVELALKTLSLKTKKSGLICFDGSYHGVDMGVLPVTSRQDFKEPFKGSLKDNVSVSIEYNNLETLKKQFLKSVAALEENGAGFSGVIVEPIQGRAGNIAASHDWLKKLIDLTHEMGGYVIFDEVFVGFGRTGRISFQKTLTQI